MKHSRSRISQPILNPLHASFSIPKGAPLGHLTGNQDLYYVPTPEHASVPAKHKETQYVTFTESSMSEKMKKE
jgi:hypothetical protein